MAWGADTDEGAAGRGIKQQMECREVQMLFIRRNSENVNAREEWEMLKTLYKEAYFLVASYKGRIICCQLGNWPVYFVNKEGL